MRYDTVNRSFPKSAVSGKGLGQTEISRQGADGMPEAESTVYLLKFLILRKNL